ncbi:MAG: hypothetical protein HY791_12275 [Deltaproteobacteria bacterium]|nr:hypothetical protein [Deltaproteobacteria bacterium]
MAVVLSDPQVRPDIVWALLRLIEERGPGATDQEIVGWMAPATLKASAHGEERGGDDSLAKRVKDARSVASKLGLMQADGWQLVSSAPATRGEFADLIHSKCLELKLWELFDPFASFVVEIEREGVAWCGSREQTVARLRDRLQRADPEDVSGYINETQWVAWIDWVTSLGLGYGGPKFAQFFPQPTQRLSRMISRLARLEETGEVTADYFLDAVGRELPYLDRGDRYKAAWYRAGGKAGREVSITLSNALRELHKANVIELRHTGGDANARRLADPLGGSSGSTFGMSGFSSVALPRSKGAL